MRWISKTLLLLVTLVLPVFIAACYGAPQRYARNEKAVGPKPVQVLDEQSDPDQSDEKEEEAKDEQD